MSRSPRFLPTSKAVGRPRSARGRRTSTSRQPSRDATGRLCKSHLQPMIACIRLSLPTKAPAVAKDHSPFVMKTVELGGGLVLDIPIDWTYGPEKDGRWWGGDKANRATIY